MCHVSCIVYGANSINENDIKGKRVIEIGSCDVNGSLRPILAKWKPAEYVGIDIEEGPGVDLVWDAEKLVDKFGKESFDVVISNELIEHTKNWKKIVSNMKNLCSLGGIVLVTTRSKGFKYHAYPNDFWRYETEDMKNIFSDFDIISLERDTEAPGVFLKAKKPNDYSEKDLSNYKLYSIVSGKRVIDIDDKDFKRSGFRRMVFKERFKDFSESLVNRIYKRI